MCLRGRMEGEDRKFFSQRKEQGTDMIKKEISNFSIKQISESGQCFRQNPAGENRYSVIAGGRYVEIEQRGKETLFSCTEEDYREFWHTYFDLDRDYGKYMEIAEGEDDYLSRAARFGGGIRILNQDLWEMIISFIISQQNNIKRIKRNVEELCLRFGEKKCSAEGILYHTFPDVHALAGVSKEELRDCNLGYRSRYIYETVRSIESGEVDLEAIKRMEYAGAKKELLKLCGVGEKVADCICLFALHHLDAFPVDTHIRQVLDNYYPKGFPMKKYEGFAGIVQQYIFYYDLMG